jgi:DNA-binding transcriptional regulator LsrR (DeoR family)
MTIDEELRKKVRKDYASGGMTQRQLAEKYGLSKGSVFYCIHDRVVPFVDAVARDTRVKKGVKLSQPDIEAIRVEYSAGLITQKALANRYGVTKLTINRIIKNRSWVND